MNDSKDNLACEIGRRIADRRMQLGLSQGQAAEKAGLSQQFFANVETGTKNIRAESILKITKALNMSADFLLTGQVSDVDCNRLMQMLKTLDEYQFGKIEDIIKDILKFSGHEVDF